MRTRSLIAVAATAVLALCACAQFAKLSQDLPTKVKLADDSLAAVLTTADNALNAHVITPATAECISTVAHSLVPFLNAARMAAKADPVSASSNLALTQGALDELSKYLTALPTGAGAPQCRL